MKKNKYEIMIETCNGRGTVKVQGNRFTINELYKYCCKYANMTTDIYNVYAVFLIKNDNIIKQYYTD